MREPVSFTFILSLCPQPRVRLDRRGRRNFRSHFPLSPEARWSHRNERADISVPLEQPYIRHLICMRGWRGLKVLNWTAFSISVHSQYSEDVCFYLVRITVCPHRLGVRVISTLSSVSQFCLQELSVVQHSTGNHVGVLIAWLWYDVESRYLEMRRNCCKMGNKALKIQGSTILVKFLKLQWPVKYLEMSSNKKKSCWIFLLHQLSRDDAWRASLHFEINIHPIRLIYESC